VKSTQLLIAAGWSAALFVLSSCAGPNLRPGFRASSPVLQREWGVGTRTREILAGERGVEFSNPVLWENTLIFGTSDEGLIAIYPNLGGQTRWVLPIRNGISSELLVQGSQIYVGGADGFFYCVNAENGRMLWRYELKNPKSSKATLAGGKLFVTTSDDVVHALDAATGRWIWHYRRKSSGAATVHGAAQPFVEAERILVGTSDGYLVALAPGDGRLLSERKLTTRTKFMDVDAAVVADGSLLFIPSYDGDLYALKRDSLEPVWRQDAGGVRSVTVDGEFLYLAASDGTIRSFRKDSGKEVWRFQLDGGTPTPITIADRSLVFGSSYQYLYALDRRTGELRDRWNAGFGSGFSGEMAYDSTKRLLYVVTGAANLLAFRVR